MIATVTMNPAVDYTVSLEAPLMHNDVNRTSQERITAGGKGVNVSLILQQLEIPTTVYGYLSGTTGSMIAEQLLRTQIPTDWINVPNQMNRINLKVKEDHAVTELNGRGVSISPAETELLLKKLSKYGDGDYIVLAGSVPAGSPPSHYADVMTALGDSGVRFAVDAEGETLRQALRCHPFVVKPNLRELCSLFDDDGTIDTWWDALPYGRKLIEWGAQNALLSLGAEGALLFTEAGRVWHLSAPHGQVKNAVGSGDAMLGGFLAGCAQGKPLTEALRMGIAAGSATAFSEWIANRSQMDNLLRTLPEPTELL
ncbi:MAG: 1-phosphofructokinase [Oscillospiraceae bacterium]|nr:1-phosphofructokinase [Oscillospiraceae bacterium]MBR5364120.1 1-phosphofructokinase [Oscillospiraceae bacterium]